MLRNLRDGVLRSRVKFIIRELLEIIRCTLVVGLVIEVAIVFVGRNETLV